jgi:C1A family cysteine protease
LFKLLILFILLLPFQVFAAGKNPCDSARSDISIYSANLIAELNLKDVSSYINETEKLVKDCRIDIAQFGWGKGIFDFWRKTNSEFLYTDAKELIEHYSKYRKISKKEFENYQLRASQFGLDLKSINSFIETNSNKGNASLLKEKISCATKIDLRNETLGQVRDQDTIGWCYAFAAADLLTYKLKTKISAADLAINYNHIWYNSILNKLGNGEQDSLGGWSDDAINATIKKGGACLEKNLRSEDNGFASLKKTLVEIDSIKNNAKTTPVISCAVAPRAMFPTLATNDYLNIIENSSKMEFMSLLSDKSCSPRISLKNIKIKKISAYLEKGRDELCNEIDKQLDSKNIVSISYNSESLYDIETKKNSNHASVIVGKKFNSTSGECEYLIRNSWGRGCNAYDGRLNCEEGNIWMPKSVLVKGLQDVTYLE